MTDERKYFDTDTTETVSSANPDRYFDTEDDANSKSIVVNTDTEGEQGVTLDLGDEETNDTETKEEGE